MCENETNSTARLFLLYYTVRATQPN